MAGSPFNFQEWLMGVMSRDAQNVHITINWNQPPPPPIETYEPIEPPANPVGPAYPGPPGYPGVPVGGGHGGGYGGGYGGAQGGGHGGVQRAGPGRPKVRKGRPEKIKGENGNSPLHDAIQDGDEALALELIGRNVDLNAKNNSGQTPLHLAVAKRSQKITKQLIEKGADTKAVDNAGKNPFYEIVNDGKSSGSSVAESNDGNNQSASTTESSEGKGESANVAENNDGKTLDSGTAEINSGKAPEAGTEEKVAKADEPASQLKATRRRREAPTGSILTRLVGSSQLTSNQPQIGGSASAVARAFAPDVAAVGDAVMLLELAMRKLTGANSESASQVPLTKDQYMARKVDAIDGRLSSALYRFSGA